MRKIATIAAATLALGWGVAKAETVDATPANDTTGVGVGVGTDTTTPPVTPATPGNPSTVQPPPAANADVNVNPITSPSYPEARPSDAPAAATTGATVETAVAPPVQPVAVQPVEPTNRDVYVEQTTWVHKVGAGILVGGGFEDFTNGTLKNMTGNGGFWTARLIAGTRQFVGLEAAYIGSARGISALGASGDARLMSNGAEGALRVNIPIAEGRSLIEPFGFVGVGWQHWTVTNGNFATADVSSRDDVLTVPYGGGLEFGYGAFLADARFTYRQTYYNNLVSSGGNLNTWGVGGQIGVEF